MSTTPTEPSEVQNPANPAEPPKEPHGTEAPTNDPKPDEQSPAQETDWKAEARKWEREAKKNKDAAAKLTEIEEASKTEAEKQAEHTAQLEAKVKEYETREQIAAWAEEVSKETEVPAALLRGSTKEELEAHAAQLKPLIGQQQTDTTQQATQQVVPTIGKQPTVQPNIPIGEQIAAAEKDGNWELAGRLKAMQLGAAPASK